MAHNRGGHEDFSQRDISKLLPDEVIATHAKTTSEMEEDAKKHAAKFQKYIFAVTVSKQERSRKFGEFVLLFVTQG